MAELLLGGIIRNGNGGYCFKIKGNMKTLQKIKDQLMKQFNNEGYDLTKQHAYFDRRDK